MIRCHRIDEAPKNLVVGREPITSHIFVEQNHLDPRPRNEFERHDFRPICEPAVDDGLRVADETIVDEYFDQQVRSARVAWPTTRIPTGRPVARWHFPIGEEHFVESRERTLALVFDAECFAGAGVVCQRCALCGLDTETIKATIADCTGAPICGCTRGSGDDRSTGVARRGACRCGGIGITISSSAARCREDRHNANSYRPYVSCLHGIWCCLLANDGEEVEVATRHFPVPARRSQISGRPRESVG